MSFATRTLVPIFFSAWHLEANLLFNTLAASVIVL